MQNNKPEDHLELRFTLFLSDIVHHNFYDPKIYPAELQELIPLFVDVIYEGVENASQLHDTQLN